MSESHPISQTHLRQSEKIKVHLRIRVVVADLAFSLPETAPEITSFVYARRG